MELSLKEQINIVKIIKKYITFDQHVDMDPIFDDISKIGPRFNRDKIDILPGSRYTRYIMGDSESNNLFIDTDGDVYFANIDNNLYISKISLEKDYWSLARNNQGIFGRSQMNKFPGISENILEWSDDDILMISMSL